MRHGLYPVKYADAAILGAIGSFAESHGYAPTVRELCEAIGCTSTSVMDYRLEQLERAGHILREPYISRSIRLVAHGGCVCPTCGGSGRVEIGGERMSEIIYLRRGINVTLRELRRISDAIGCEAQ